MEFTFFWSVSFRGSRLLCLGGTWWRFTNWWDWVSHASTTYYFMKGACPYACMIHRSCCSIIIETHKFLRVRTNQRPPVPCKRLQPWVSCYTVNQIPSQSEIQSKKSGWQLWPQTRPLTPEILEASFPAGNFEKFCSKKSYYVSVPCMTAKNVDITHTRYCLNRIEPPDL